MACRRKAALWPGRSNPRQGTGWGPGELHLEETCGDLDIGRRIITHQLVISSEIP